ncbi:MAG: hypothetical protein SFZ24_02290 [Planctomycetota bacterium]|nr:hypothetical protein [Planctomycetota bacterium]
MSYARAAGLAMMLFGLLSVGVAVPFMASRLSHRDIPIVYFTQPGVSPQFEFRGEPGEVRTIDPPADQPETRSVIEIHWRGEVLRYEIEPGMRDETRLPGLLRHEDWLRVLIMAEGARSDVEIMQGVQEGRIEPRLIITMRRPAEDYEPGSWGDVRRKEWRYRFIELLPPGKAGADGSVFSVSESTYGELDKLADRKYRAEHGLQDEVWKYFAMQHVTPPTLVRARSRPIAEAMQAMGWTWPVGGIGIMVFVVGAVAFGASGVARRG